MANQIERFENIVMRARVFTEARLEPTGGSHPFDERNIHSRIELASKKLFDGMLGSPKSCINATEAIRTYEGRIEDSLTKEKVSGTISLNSRLSPPAVHPTS